MTLWLGFYFSCLLCTGSGASTNDWYTLGGVCRTSQKHPLVVYYLEGSRPLDIILSIPARKKAALFIGKHAQDAHPEKITVRETLYRYRPQDTNVRYWWTSIDDKHTGVFFYLPLSPRPSVLIKDLSGEVTVAQYERKGMRVEGVTDRNAQVHVDFRAVDVDDEGAFSAPLIPTFKEHILEILAVRTRYCVRL